MLSSKGFLITAFAFTSALSNPIPMAMPGYLLRLERFHPSTLLKQKPYSNTVSVFE